MSYYLILIFLLSILTSKLTSSSKIAKNKPKDIDKYGCCLSCGEFYCQSSEKCVSDWDECEVGWFDAHHCKYHYNNTIHGFNFDLSNYIASDDTPDATYYKITDEVHHEKQTFMYYFNLCKTIPSESLPEVCLETKGSAAEECSNDALAYQYFKADWGFESCYRLSDCVKTSKRIELGLLDPVEPAAGIYIKYAGGNSCENSYSDKAQCFDTIEGDEKTYCARTFKLNIQCHNEITEIPEREEIEEAVGCSYETTINHQMGCPMECPRNIDNGRVCSGRGLCFYAGYDAGDTVDLLNDVS